jgi:prepilin-type N-terminal cleavage/methylation domain-containing protein
MGKVLSNKIKKRQQYERGYSLIELMVAVSVFAIVMSVSSGMFITSMKGQRKAFSNQNLADNVRYAMEIITREVRMGRGFTVGNAGTCSNNCLISFTSSMPRRDGKTVTFFLDPNTKKIMFDDDTSAGPPADPITSANIEVTNLDFALDIGEEPYRVTIVLEAESVGTAIDTKSNIILQTTIAPRVL